MSSPSPETPNAPDVAESTQDARSLDQGIGPDPAQIRQACNRFRILVVGRANAGKTTLLKKFCQSKEEPDVWNERGEQIGASVVNPSVDRGIHNINHEITYRSNPSFVFHDSMGIESGSSVHSRAIHDFLQDRDQNTDLEKRVHAIWFCVPAGQARVLGDTELEFFKHSTNGIPVIVIFTKWDMEIKNAVNALRNQGKTRQQGKTEAPQYAREHFQQLHVIQNTPYPPRSYIYLQDMHQPDTDCSELSTVTAQVLDDGVVKMLFISRQLVCDRLSAEWAIRDMMKFEGLVKMDRKMEVRRIVQKGTPWFAWLNNYWYNPDWPPWWPYLEEDDDDDDPWPPLSSLPETLKAICQSLSVQDIKLTRGSLSFAILAAEVVVLGASACHVARLRDVDHPSHILGILRAQGKIQKMHAEIRSAWEKDEDWVKILKTLWHRNEEEHKKAAQAIIEIAWKYLWDGKE